MTISVDVLILEHWQHHATQTERHLVLPDGCEDLICSVSTDGKPTWFVFDLADSAHFASSTQGSTTQGLRFSAGAQIHKSALLASIANHTDMNDIKKDIGNFVSVDANVADALAVPSLENSVASAASVLGVSARSLQRLLVKHTQKPPSFWCRLGRVRV